jgi:hypothetical protein
VYWVDQGSAQQSALDGVVARIPVAGCADAGADCIVAMAMGEHSPSAIAVNTQAAWWATIEPSTTASHIRTLAFGDVAPKTFASQQNYPRGLALDDTSVFWVNAGDAPPTANGEVRRQFFDSASGLAIVSSLDSPVAITVRAGAVFWTNDGDADNTGYVMTSDITGTPAARIASNQSHPRGIAAGPTYVYWTNMGDGTIMRARPDGTEIARIASSRATPSDIAVDDTSLYWVEAGTPPDYADGRVIAANLDGTNMRTIDSAQKDPRRIALDDASVYWIARGTRGCTQHDGTVMRAGKR